jgi:hypothetical protein
MPSWTFHDGGDGSDYPGPKRRSVYNLCAELDHDRWDAGVRSVFSAMKPDLENIKCCGMVMR